jgi:hypothetical protein
MQFPAYGYTAFDLWEEPNFQLSEDQTALYNSVYEFVTKYLWRSSDDGHRVDMTLADIEVIQEMQAKLADSVINTENTGVDHSTYFVAEDNPYVSPATAFVRYLVFGSHFDVVDRVRTDLERVHSGALDFMKPVNQLLKNRLQRPRPNQASWMLRQQLGWSNQLGLRFRLSLSAHSPAIPSGHAVVALSLLSRTLSKKTLDGWQHYGEDALNDARTVVSRMSQAAIDFGDRRVMAGIHYPSDNLASWYMALEESRLLNLKTEKDLVASMSQSHMLQSLRSKPIYEPALKALGVF